MESERVKFHFVNKSASSKSLSSSEGQARFEIFRNAHLRASTRTRPKTGITFPHYGAARTLEAPHGLSDVQAGPKLPRVNTELLIPSDAEFEQLEISLNEWRQRTTLERRLPTSMLSGYSDPFNAQGIVITPRINRLITFIRDAYLPSVYLTPHSRRCTQNCPKDVTMANCGNLLGGPSAIRNWQTLQEGFSSEGGGSAWISSWIPLIVQLAAPSEAREWQVIGLKLRAHSIEALRKYLSQRQNQTDPLPMSVALHVTWLFKADCGTGDPTSAIAHVRLLCTLVESMPTFLQQTQLLVTVLFNDVEMATATMRKTLFDLDQWVSKRLTPVWTLGEAYLPEVPEEYKDLHDSVQTGSVRSVALRLRRCLLFDRAPIAIQDAESVRIGSIVYAWMGSHNLYGVGILMNAHMDLVENEESNLTAAQRLTEAAIALTMLQLLRKSMHTAVIDGIDRRDLSSVIIPRLRSTLEKAMSLSNPEDRSHYREAYLWMFHTGAQSEQSRERAGTTGFGKSPFHRERWFSDKFVEQARLLNVTTWQEVESVLVKFVFNPYLEPCLETWFQETIREAR